MSGTKRVEIVLADDSDHFRRGLAAVLGTDPGLEVIGEAATGEEAVDLVARTAPDVAIIDLRMPGMGGVAATSAIRAVSPVTRVLVLTVSDDEDDLLGSILAGAHGFLLKDTAIEDVPGSIREVVHGGAPLSPLAAAVLWNEYFRLAATGIPRRLLVPPQARALELRAKGASAVEIAAGLGATVPAVTRHLQDAAEKVRFAGTGHSGRSA